MSKHNTQPDWTPEAPAPDEPAPADVDDARPPAEPVADDPPPVLPGPAAWADIPVASVLPPTASLIHPPALLTPLEERILRLEAELARLRGAPPAEARLTDRPVPTQQLQARPPDAAASVVRDRGRFWGDLGKRLLAPSAPASAPPPPRPDGLAAMIPANVRRTWLVFDALAQLRAIYWMYFDPRYRLSWAARLTPLVILALIFTSWLWVPGATIIPILGGIVEKIADLFLAYVLFKLLSHEARRYRETAPDLPAGLRL